MHLCHNIVKMKHSCLLIIIVLIFQQSTMLKYLKSSYFFYSQFHTLSAIFWKTFAVINVVDFPNLSFPSENLVAHHHAKAPFEHDRYLNMR